MKLVAVVFLISCFEYTVIGNIELKCKFGTISGWYIPGELYYCKAQGQGDIITERSNRTITLITGNHQKSNTNANVKVIWIDSLKVFYFPLNLVNFFTDLVAIRFDGVKLREIRKEDLKDFKNLRAIYFHNNEIHFLEPNLFQFNPKLESIVLYYNKISHIDAKVFDSFVGKLNYLFLSGNICQLEDAKNNKQNADKIIAKIQEGSCKDESKLLVTTTTTTTAPKTITTTLATTTSQPIPKTTTTTTSLLPINSVPVDDLKKLMEELSNKLKADKKSLDLQLNLDQEFKALKSEVSGQKDELATLKDKLKASESQIQSLNEQIKTQDLLIKDQNTEIKDKLENYKSETKSDIQSLHDQIKKQDVVIKNQDSDLKNKLEIYKNETYSDIQSLHDQIKNQDLTIKKQDVVMNDQNTEIKDKLENYKSETKSDIQSLQDQINHQDLAIKNHDSLIKNQNSEIRDKLENFKNETKSDIQSLHEQIKNQDLAIKNQDVVIKNQDSEIKNKLETYKNETKSDIQNLTVQIMELKEQNFNIETGLKSITTEFDKCGSCAVNVLAKRVKYLENILSIDSSEK